MALTPNEKRIRTCLERLRGQLGSGDDSEILCWVIPGILACSQRPLRDHPTYAPPSRGHRPSPLPEEARDLVITWVRRVLDLGIRSVVCLLKPAQLDKYYKPHFSDDLWIDNTLPDAVLARLGFLKK